MKKMLSVLILLSIFGNVSLAQKSKKKAKATMSLEIAGGYFYHGLILENEQSNFTGFTTGSIGLYSTKKDWKRGFALDYVGGSTEFSVPSYIIDVDRNALFLGYSMSKNVLKSKSNTFFIGGFASILRDKVTRIPRIDLAYPYHNILNGFMIGCKMEYNASIGKNMYIVTGLKLGILEGGWDTTKKDDPQLPSKLQKSTETYFEVVGAKRLTMSLGIGIRL